MSKKERQERLVQLFKKRLNLTADQERVVREALAKSFEEMKPIRRKIEPELSAVRERARETIRKILTVEQLQRYEEMVARYKARRAKKLK